jgi:hypothetical protein
VAMAAAVVAAATEAAAVTVVAAAVAAMGAAGRNVPFLVSTVYLTRHDYFSQCFGSGSGLDPGSIRSVDLDPNSESGFGSGSRRAKRTHKNWKSYEISCFEVLDVLF